MIDTDNKLPIGIVHLQDAAKPPLTGGHYDLTSTLTLSDEQKPEKDQDPFKEQDPFTHTLNFYVDAPRYQLAPELIHSVYPAPGMCAHFGETLPHLVFSRKTIPWERTVNDKPWLTLLLFTEKELNGFAPIQELNVEEISKDKPELYVPLIEPEAHEKKLGRIKVLEIPLATFNKLAARPSDADLLVHTKQVDTTDKENTDDNPKGWYATMVCNRLPRQDQNHTVFLVSLEGHEKAWLGPQESGKSKIRLILLHQWSFRSEGPSLFEMVEQLESNICPLYIDVPKSIEDTPAGNALKWGYIPLQHQLRSGKQSVSWYRGPLIPAQVVGSSQRNYRSPDEALRFDEATGLFNVSYSVAWQLGRLLALQQPAFTVAINNWKTGFRRELPLLIARDLLKKGFGLEPAMDDGHSSLPQSSDTKSQSIPGSVSLSKIIHDSETNEVLQAYLFELWNAANNG